MSDNPATTGEWMVDWLYEYARQREGYKTICELHNSALAAAKEEMRTSYKPPKPTVGEWTAETVMAIAKSGFAFEACERIAQAHNAAIDAALAKT